MDFRTDERDVGDVRVWDGRTSFGRLTIAGSLLLVIGGFVGSVWYAYDSYSQSLAGAAPLIQADPAPVRLAPEDPGGLSVAHQDRLLLQGEPVPTEPADQPIAEAERPLPRPAGDGTTGPLAGADLPVFATDGAPSADPSVRPIEALIERRPSDGLPRLSLAPLASGEEQRHARMVPIIRPVEPAALLAAAEGGGALGLIPLPPVQPAAGPPPAPVPSPQPAEPAIASPSPSRVAQILALTEAMPEDPDALARALRAVPARSAAVLSDDEPAASRPGTGSYRIQLAAIGGDDVAEDEWRRINGLHGDLLAGLELHVEQVTVNGRIYRRIQAGPLAPADAQSLCETLRARGADCLVRP